MDVDIDGAVRAWDEHGFVILPAYLPPAELAGAVADLPTLYPTADESAISDSTTSSAG